MKSVTHSAPRSLEASPHHDQSCSQFAHLAFAHLPICPSAPCSPSTDGDTLGGDTCCYTTAAHWHKGTYACTLGTYGVRLIRSQELRFWDACMTAWPRHRSSGPTRHTHGLVRLATCKLPSAVCVRPKASSRGASFRFEAAEDRPGPLAGLGRGRQWLDRFEACPWCPWCPWHAS